MPPTVHVCLKRKRFGFIFVLFFVFTVVQDTTASDNITQPEDEPLEDVTSPVSDVAIDNESVTAALPTAIPSTATDSPTLLTSTPSTAIDATTSATSPAAPASSNTPLPPSKGFSAWTQWAHNAMAAKYMGTLALLYVCVCLFMALRQGPIFIR